MWTYKNCADLTRLIFVLFFYVQCGASMILYFTCIGIKLIWRVLMIDLNMRLYSISLLLEVQSIDQKHWHHLGELVKNAECRCHPHLLSQNWILTEFPSQCFLGTLKFECCSTSLRNVHSSYTWIKILSWNIAIVS